MASSGRSRWATLLLRCTPAPQKKAPPRVLAPAALGNSSQPWIEDLTLLKKPGDSLLSLTAPESLQPTQVADAWACLAVASLPRCNRLMSGEGIDHTAQFKQVLT